MIPNLSSLPINVEGSHCWANVQELEVSLGTNNRPIKKEPILHRFLKYPIVQSAVTWTIQYQFMEDVIVLISNERKSALFIGVG